jgi:hypothetical protein
MTTEEFTYRDFIDTRKKLSQTIIESLTEKDKQFLLSMKMGEPKYDLFPVKEIEKLPAVQWKLQNLLKLKKVNQNKHNLMIEALEIKLFNDDQKQ